MDTQTPGQKIVEKWLSQTHLNSEREAIAKDIDEALSASRSQEAKEETPEELFEEGMELMTKLLPPHDYGESYDCERLQNILKELSERASQVPTQA
jgi:hypothetical protein